MMPAYSERSSLLTAICRESAVEQRRMVASGFVRPNTPRKAAKAAKDALNRDLNAIVYSSLPTYRNFGSRGRLYGVPVTFKLRPGAEIGDDLGWSAADYQPTEMVDRFRGEGATIVGGTATSPGAVGTETASRRYGVTRNPWDLNRCVGGSSGGAAAAVASGLCAIAEATDSGGSIRIPAAFCAVVGLKPTPGAIPEPPVNSASASLGTHGVIARTVGDARLGFYVLAGKSPAAKSDGSVPRSRIAVVRRYAGSFDTAIDEAHLAVVERAVEALRYSGHVVVDEQPKHFFSVGTDQAGPTFAGFHAAELLGQWEERAKKCLKPPLIGDFFAVLAEYGRSLNFDDLAFAVAQVQAFRQALIGEMQESGIDFILSPTVAQPARRAGTLYDANSPLQGTFQRMVSDLCLTVPANFAGLPALSLPFGVHTDGMPIGIQLMGRECRDDALLDLAEQLEAMAPDIGRPKHSVWNL